MEIRSGADPLLGTTIDETIEIQSVLGSGGMGVVYKGFHKTLEKPVAVKVLSQALANDSQALQRFKSEAESLSALDHPNVVKILRFGILNEGTSRAIPYLVLEFIDGTSLQDRLASTTMELNEVWSVLSQISAGIAAAHKVNMVHRDIKPSNVMFAGKTAKVVDFGISKSLTPTEIQKLTQTGALLGTPLYMSPEQLASKPPSTESDVYAIGCVLFEMLYAKPYASGENILEIAMNKLNPTTALADRTASGATVPSALRALLAKMLDAEPARRLQNAIELSRLIEQIQLNPEDTHGELALPPPTSPTTASAKSSMKLVPVIAVCLAMVGTLAFLFFLQAPSNETKTLNSMRELCLLARQTDGHANPAPWNDAQRIVQAAMQINDDGVRAAVDDNLRMLADVGAQTEHATDPAGIFFLKHAAQLPAPTQDLLLKRFNYLRVAFVACMVKFNKTLTDPKVSARERDELYKTTNDLLDDALATGMLINPGLQPKEDRAVFTNFFVDEILGLLQHHYSRYHSLPLKEGKSEADKALQQARATIAFIDHNPDYFAYCKPNDLQLLASHLNSALGTNGTNAEQIAFIDSLQHGPAAALWTKAFEDNYLKLAVWKAEASSNSNLKSAKEGEQQMLKILAELNAKHSSPPELGQIYFALARAQFGQERFEEALKNFDRAGKLASRLDEKEIALMHVNVNLWRVGCYSYLQRFAEAEQALKDVRVSVKQLPKQMIPAYEQQADKVEQMLASMRPATR